MKRARECTAASRWFRVAAQRPALLLDLFQEGKDAGGCQILDGQPVDGLAGSAHGEGQEET